MNNPPAFPGKQKALMIQSEHVGIASEYEIEHNGMTLRDYFAAKFIHPAFEDGNFLFDKEDYKKLANICYEMADAMLNARES